MSPAAGPPRDPALQELLDKEEIRDVLLRYCRAVDRRDEALLRSAYHPDAVHAFGPVRESGYEMAARIVRDIGRYDVTAHYLTNARVRVAGDRARAESYVVAVHRVGRGEQTREWVLALRYVDVLERREGAWRIAQRLCVHDWSRESAAPGGLSPLAAALVQGRRDRQDPSYGDGGEPGAW